MKTIHGDISVKNIHGDLSVKYIHGDLSVKNIHGNISVKLYMVIFHSLEISLPCMWWSNRGPKTMSKISRKNMLFLSWYINYTATHVQIFKCTTNTCFLTTKLLCCKVLEVCQIFPVFTDSWGKNVNNQNLLYPEFEEEKIDLIS